MLLLRRQSKGFVRTTTKFRGVTKDRVSHDDSTTAQPRKERLYQTGAVYRLCL